MSNINLNERMKIVCEPQSAIDKMQQEIDSLQAKIDSLMLEYCPDEMTDEQLTNWANHQRVSDLSK